MNSIQIPSMSSCLSGIGFSKDILSKGFNAADGDYTSIYRVIYDYEKVKWPMLTAIKYNYIDGNFMNIETLPDKKKYPMFTVEIDYPPVFTIPSYESMAKFWNIFKNKRFLLCEFMRTSKNIDNSISHHAMMIYIDKKINQWSIYDCNGEYSSSYLYTSISFNKIVDFTQRWIYNICNIMDIPYPAYSSLPNVNINYTPPGIDEGWCDIWTTVWARKLVSSSLTAQEQSLRIKKQLFLEKKEMHDDDCNLSFIQARQILYHVYIQKILDNADASNISYIRDLIIVSVDVDIDIDSDDDSASCSSDSCSSSDTDIDTIVFYKYCKTILLNSCVCKYFRII